MNRNLSCAALLLSSLAIAGCGEREREVEKTFTDSITSTTFNASGAPTVAFAVPDMMCPDSCAVKAKEILAAQPGVKDVQVDFDTKTATVTIDERKFDAALALAALTDRFDAATLKDGADAKPQAEETPAVQ